MRKRAVLKDYLREYHTYLNRTVWLLLAVIILMAVLVFRLIQLQVVQYDRYTTLSNNNRVSLVPLSPPRGLIFDRNGVLLAENIPSFSLDLVAERVPADTLDFMLAELQTLLDLTDDEITAFHARHKKRRRFETVPIRTSFSEEARALFEVNRHRFPGIEVTARLIRHYPLGENTAHVLGYVGLINSQELARIDTANYSATHTIGKVGIEHYYETLLHGQVGYRQVERNARGYTVRVLEDTPPVPGQDLHLTLDSQLQITATEALGNRRGAVVAIDPNTGGILAMVSAPTFDPNLFVSGTSEQRSRALESTGDRPLFNRAISGQYPPGSTIKPALAIIGLEQGKITPHTSQHCPGWYELPNYSRRYRDWQRSGHGHMNLEQAIAQSCAIFFYDLAVQLGIDTLYEEMSAIGFGQATGLDISHEMPGLMPSPEWKRRTRGESWFPGETVITGIGQGYTLSTPLQLAKMTSMLAMRGKNYQPYLLQKSMDANNRETRMPLRYQMMEAQSEHWDYVIEAMYQVIASPRGTGYRLTQPTPVYQMAGKTGTSQVTSLSEGESTSDLPAHLQDNSSFIVFAPIESPEIALAVILENTDGAAAIARAVLDQYLLSDTQLTSIDDDAGGDHVAT